MAVVNIATNSIIDGANSVPTDAFAAKSGNAGGYVGDARQTSSSGLFSGDEGRRNAVSEGEARGSASRVAEARENWRRLWIRPDSVWALLHREKISEGKADVHGVAAERSAARIGDSRNSSGSSRSGAFVRTGAAKMNISVAEYRKLARKPKKYRNKPQRIDGVYFASKPST